MNINYQSDFKLLEVSSVSDTISPFRFTYRTSALSSYVAQFDGESYTACRRMDDESLLVVFEGHTLPAGALEVRREYFLTDEDFAKGICHHVSVESLDIALTTGESDQLEVEVSVSPNYVAVGSGYTPVKGVDYVTEEDVSGVVEECREELLVESVGNDTTRAMSQDSATKAFVQYNNEYLEELFAYGVEYDTSNTSPTCTRIGNASMHRTLPIQSKMRGCLLDDDGQVLEYLPDDDWSSATRDGSAGQVMVEIPAHYRKFVTDGTSRQIWLSEYDFSGYHLVPKMYVSAYEASLNRTTLKLSSVVNQAADYRGGNDNTAYDGTYRTFLGRPVSFLSLSIARAYARERNSSTSEWNCYTYLAHVNIFWLFVVEYSTLNSQESITSELTSEGYHQGGLGNGVSTISTINWGALNGCYPFVPCGHTDSLGNGTGELIYTVESADQSLTVDVYANRYRGIENPFGHIHKWVDGILVDIKNSSDGATSSVYVAMNVDDYNSESVENYEYRGQQSRGSATYIREIIFGEYGDIIASVTSGGSSIYFCDHNYTAVSSSSMRGVLVGGWASSAAGGGLAFSYTNSIPSASQATFGTRLCFHPNN